MHRPKINGLTVMRPSHPHPNPSHWDSLRVSALERDGHACRCCPNDAASGIPLEIHHRHYANWGHESLDDVVTLCVLCHDAITSRIRETTEYTVAPPERMARPEKPTVALQPVTVSGPREVRERPAIPSVKTSPVSVEVAPRGGLPPRDKPQR